MISLIGLRGIVRQTLITKQVKDFFRNPCSCSGEANAVADRKWNIHPEVTNNDCHFQFNIRLSFIHVGTMSGYTPGSNCE
jgi:hypothetical protein